MLKLTDEKVDELMARHRRAFYSDGYGLYLVTKESGTANWVFRYWVDGRCLRSVGLGSVQDYSLAEARERAWECRRLRDNGIDPLAHYRARRAAAKDRVIARYEGGGSPVPMAAAAHE